MFKRSGFCRMHGVASDTLDKIVELLDKRAAPRAKQAEKVLNAPPAASRPSSPTKSPTKRELPHGGSPHKKAAPVRELPHGGSPHKKAAPVRELPHGGSPHKKAAPVRELPHGGSPHKPQASPRKVPPPLPALFPNLPQPSSAAESGSDDEVDFLSPRKRRKVTTADKRDESPSPARSRAARSPSKASPAKAAAEPADAHVHVSPRRSTRVQEMEDTVVIQTSPRKARKAVEVPMEVDSDTSEDEKQPQVRRRFRPVFLDTVQWNARDPLDVGVAAVVNALPHNLIVERVDPPLRGAPREGEEVRAQYAFSNQLGRKVVNCKLTTMSRSGGRGTTKKVMCRVGGGESIWAV